MELDDNRSGQQVQERTILKVTRGETGILALSAIRSAELISRNGETRQVELDIEEARLMAVLLDLSDSIPPYSAEEFLIHYNVNWEEPLTHDEIVIKLNSLVQKLPEILIKHAEDEPITWLVGSTFEMEEAQE